MRKSHNELGQDKWLELLLKYYNSSFAFSRCFTFLYILLPGIPSVPVNLTPAPSSNAAAMNQMNMSQILQDFNFRTQNNSS